MGEESSPSTCLAQALLLLLVVVQILVFSNAIYNVYLHPLRNVPGPFWARASGLPSWYYSLTGRRHLWLLRLFQTYGKRVRVSPDRVLFCDPEAFAAIYNTKANVRRSLFYSGMSRNHREVTTINTIDPAEHARRRKILNTCFTDSSVTAVSAFVCQHVDRWHQLLLDEYGGTKESGWSAPIDLRTKLDHLVFDIMGDLSFGQSFNIKEPGENPLGVVPHSIAMWLKLNYPICHSPFLNLIIWLKPRGLDRLMELASPKPIRQFNKFVFDSVTRRLELYREQEMAPTDEHRRDMFYFLCKAYDPDIGGSAYTEDDLRAEAFLFIIAGSDTTSVSLASIFWYLVRAPTCYEKLVNEVRSTFETAFDIILGPKLLGCTYLRACIDEGMRLMPPGPCEPPREVLSGGLNIMGDHYPAGTIVGTAPWCDSRNDDVYGDAGVFRPERWIVGAGVTQEMVAKIRTNFHPFLAGPGGCAGRQVAMAELLIVLAKTLHRFHLRKATGSNAGEGRPEMGWGANDRNQFQAYDAYISIIQGPEVQLRKRE